MGEGRSCQHPPLLAVAGKTRRHLVRLFNLCAGKRKSTGALQALPALRRHPTRRTDGKAGEVKTRAAFTSLTHARSDAACKPATSFLLPWGRTRCRHCVSCGVS